MKKSLFRCEAISVFIAFGIAVGLSACGGGGDGSNALAASQGLTCDDSMKAAFKPDASTSVVAVKAFQKGDALVMSGVAAADAPKATNEICVVKLNVGPGNGGPVSAPSTSPGIGIEIWLPAKTAWNQRVHAIGGGGWQGGPAGNAAVVASTQAASIAATEGAVSSTTDTGHATFDGSFAMNPDGSINTTLWVDFASRSIHEQALKTKALATAFFGSAPKYSYWEGGSTGGRQGLSLAQNNPGDFDGIIANYPAINWSQFITNELYPQIVYQRDLGGVPLTTAQQDLLSNAAIASCDLVGGRHLGYVPDPASCNYDPTKDKAVLCTSAGGINASSSCVTTVQATAINKIWYGMTPDGSVPTPATDSGWTDVTSSTLPTSGRWWGQTRGTSLYGAFFAFAGLNGLASPVTPFPIASDQVALELLNPRIAQPTFVNAVSNGQNLWKNLSYSDLATAFAQGVTLQPQFGNINTDNPDLSVFKARGGKILSWHGLADELIMPQGSINYYNRVANIMGGLANVQSFFRLYLVPGAGHGTPNGTSNPTADVPNFTSSQQYAQLIQWVEQGIAPEAATLVSAGGNSGLACVYPQKAAYKGIGDPTKANSYVCS